MYGAPEASATEFSFRFYPRCWLLVPGGPHPKWSTEDFQGEFTLLKPFYRSVKSLLKHLNWSFYPLGLTHLLRTKLLKLLLIYGREEKDKTGTFQALFHIVFEKKKGF